MKKTGKVRKIDFSRGRLGIMADKYYNEGNFVSALKFAHRELNEYGGDGEVFARLADIYEGMQLQGTAIRWWFRYLDVATEEELPDVYESLAVNFLTLGQESQSAYYYNQLLNADEENLPEDFKMDIAEAFASPKKSKLRFVYPPRLADYSEEIRIGSQALKLGDCDRAIQEFSTVTKGSKQYAQAMEMCAVAHLLKGETEAAELVCNDLLQIEPDNVRVLATLAAVYIEQGRNAESRAIAEQLAERDSTDAEDLYKIATVCCENGLHEAAYAKFRQLDQKTPYDGRVLYFKGVSAYKSGYVKESIKTFSELCTIYPDAEVAKYYRKELCRYDEEGGEPPELIYFYHLPQAERERRCDVLVQVSESSKEDAQLFGLLLLYDGYLDWCFDEMDGEDKDLQFLGLVTATHARADEFVQNKLLDPEVADVLKLETLRLLYERNEDAEFGLVLCNIYKRITVRRIALGRKRRKKFLEGYAKVASKFTALRDDYGVKMKRAAEGLYQALAEHDALNLVESADDCACAVYMMTGLKELGNNPTAIAAAFDADVERVKALLTAAVGSSYGVKKEENRVGSEGENEHETH